jgi:hypothetical protein
MIRFSLRVVVILDLLAPNRQDRILEPWLKYREGPESDHIFSRASKSNCKNWLEPGIQEVYLTACYQLNRSGSWQARY